LSYLAMIEGEWGAGRLYQPPSSTQPAGSAARARG